MVDEVLFQKVKKLPCMPTLSELKDHRGFPSSVPDMVPESVEAFAHERAHLASLTEAREFPFVSVDYFFFTAKGVLTNSESENKWDDPLDP